MPIGSRRMCGSGFNVTCPPREAVSSPPIFATRACAASWQVVEKRKAMYQINPKASTSGDKSGMAVTRVEVRPLVCKAPRPANCCNFPSASGVLRVANEQTQNSTVASNVYGSGYHLDENSTVASRVPALDFVP